MPPNSKKTPAIGPALLTAFFMSTTSMAFAENDNATSLDLRPSIGIKTDDKVRPRLRPSIGSETPEKTDTIGVLICLDASADENQEQPDLWIKELERLTLEIGCFMTSPSGDQEVSKQLKSSIVDLQHFLMGYAMEGAAPEHGPYLEAPLNVYLDTNGVMGPETAAAFIKVASHMHFIPPFLDLDVQPEHSPYGDQSAQKIYMQKFVQEISEYSLEHYFFVQDLVQEFLSNSEKVQFEKRPPCQFGAGAIVIQPCALKA